jgi:hypothetical protein
MRNQLARLQSLTTGGFMKLRLACSVLVLLISTGLSFAQTGSKNSPNTNGFPRVVAQIALTNKSSAIPLHTLFTPRHRGLYRVSVYMAALSSVLPQDAGWSFGLSWTDQTDTLESFGVTPILLQGNLQVEQDTHLISPEPGFPVSITVSPTSPPPVDSTYTLLFTVEQLQ